MAKRGRPRIRPIVVSGTATADIDDATVNTDIAGADASADDAGAGGDTGTDAIETVDPGSIGTSGNVGTDAADERPRKRGRPAGSGRAGSASRRKTLDINAVEGLLLSIHMGVAAITKIPEIAIDKTEATMLASSMDRVAQHYDLGASQKAIDWAHLIGVCGMVYGTRMIAYWSRKPAPPPRPVAVAPAPSGSAPASNVTPLSPDILAKLGNGALP